MRLAIVSNLSVEDKIGLGVSWELRVLYKIKTPVYVLRKCHCTRLIKSHYYVHAPVFTATIQLFAGYVTNYSKTFKHFCLYKELNCPVCFKQFNCRVCYACNKTIILRPMLFQNIKIMYQISSCACHKMRLRGSEDVRRLVSNPTLITLSFFSDIYIYNTDNFFSALILI